MSAPKLAVVYDVGGTPLEIARGLEGVAQIVFVVPDTAHTRSVREVLEQVAPVVDHSRLEFTVEELRRHGVEGVVTYSEPALRLTSALGVALGFAVHSEVTVRDVTDKTLQRLRLRQAGVELLWSEAVESRRDLALRASQIDYPVIVKPRVGGASRAVAHLDDADDLHRYVTSLGQAPDEPLHLEQVINGRPNDPFGDLISVETATLRGETRLIAITGNFKQIPPFRETGHLWPAVLTDDERLAALDLTLRAIDALGIRDGITHTEFKLAPDGPQLIEVNARLGGFINEMCASDPDADLFAAAGLIALGLEPWDALPTQFAAFTFVFMQEPPLEARRLIATYATPRTRRMAKRYKTLHVPPSTLRTDLGTEWLDAFVSVAPDAGTMFDRLSDHVAQTHFEFEFDDGSVGRVNGSELPSASVLNKKVSQ